MNNQIFRIRSINACEQRSVKLLPNTSIQRDIMNLVDHARHLLHFFRVWFYPKRLRVHPNRLCKLLCLLEPSFFLILLFYKKSYKHAVHNNVKSRRRIHSKSTINQSCWLRIVGFVCHVSCTTHKTSVVCLILITSLQQQYSIWKENIHMFYTKA